MSDKEGYFPPNTEQSVINDTLYTDYGFLTSLDAVGSLYNKNQYNNEGKIEIPSETPF